MSLVKLRTSLSQSQKVYSYNFVLCQRETEDLTEKNRGAVGIFGKKGISHFSRNGKVPIS